MKFSIPLIALSVSSTTAFNANLRAGSSATRLMATKGAVDASQLIQEAMKITDKHGATSSQARLAWEAVEEVNASDNSAASMGSLVDECDVEIVSQECLEYNDALEDLQELLEETAPPHDEASMFAKELASTVEPVKLSVPNTGSAPPSAALQKALVEARKITSRKGLASSEAAVAWETVEQIAAAGNANALGGSLTADECYVEAAKEACDALEELHKIVGDVDSSV